MNEPSKPSTLVGAGHSRSIVSTGQMAELIRSHCWASTALGPIESWPPTLVFTINLILSCPLAAAVYWGPEMIFIGNDASARMIGPRAVETLGLPAQQHWGEYWSEVEERFRAVFSSGESFQGESAPFYFSRAHKPDEIFINYTLSPIYEDGKIVGIYRILEETTEAVLAMRALAESNERLRMALSAGGGVGVWDWHIQAGIVYADENAAKLYGIDPKAAAAGTSNLLYERMLHPDDIRVLTDAVMGCIATGAQYKVDYRVRRADGSYGWVQSIGRCVYDENGHACRVTGVKLGIPDHKDAEREENSVAPRPELLPREEWAKIAPAIRLLLEGTFYAIADKPDEIRLKVMTGVTDTQLILQVASTDLGKIIGKQGHTIRSIRTVLHAVNGTGMHRHTLDIEANSTPELA